jgi:hypothetical protein
MLVNVCFVHDLISFLVLAFSDLCLHSGTAGKPARYNAESLEFSQNPFLPGAPAWQAADLEGGSVAVMPGALPFLVEGFGRSLCNRVRRIRLGLK